MKFSRRRANRPFALFPASLLKNGQHLHQIASHAPTHAYVLVSKRNNRWQTQFFRKLGHSLEQRGIKVWMLSL